VSRRAFPPSSRSWTVRERDGIASFEIGPPGFNRRHAAVLGMAGMWAVMIFPLSVMGLMLGIQARDWEIGIRAACILGGAIGLIISLGPIVWTCAHAMLWRERIQVGPQGVLIRIGLPLRANISRTSAVALQSSIAKSSKWSPYPERLKPYRSALALQWPQLSISVGLGLADDEQRALLAELHARLKPLKAAGAESTSPEEWRYPWTARLLGPFWNLAVALLGPFRRPLPYLVFDILTLGAAVALPLFSLDVGLSRYYPVLYGAFIFGLVLRRWDRHYLRGIAIYDKRYMWFPVMYGMASLAVGLAGAFALSKHLGWGIGTGVALVIAVAVHVDLLKRGAKTPVDDSTERNPLFDALATATLIPIAIVHEQATFMFFEDTARRYFVLSMAMIPPVVGFVYLPIRMHFFIDAPNDRSNAVWFGLTMVALTIYAVFGFGGA